MRLLFSVIKDNVKLGIAAGTIDSGYCVVAIKPFWQILKSNKQIQSEFVGPTPHLEYLVTILLEIAYAKQLNKWPPGETGASLYLNQS